MDQKNKITKHEEARLWNLQHSSTADGNMYYNEKEERFRLRKKVDKKSLTTISSKSTLDAEIKMNLLEKKNLKKEKTKKYVTFADEISTYYTNVLRKGYRGKDKRKKERKVTSITRLYSTIKNQILDDKISKIYMQSIQKKDLMNYFLYMK